jgi:hypothetical protein
MLAAPVVAWILLAAAFSFGCGAAGVLRRSSVLLVASAFVVVLTAAFSVTVLALS